MKKVLALVLALVLVLSLVACGEEKEQKTVNSVLQGKWSGSFTSDTLQTFEFSNGQYRYVEYWSDPGVNVVDETGTYTIDAKLNEINCVCTKRKHVENSAGNTRTLKYKLDSADNLTVKYVDTELFRK